MKFQLQNLPASDDTKILICKVTGIKTQAINKTTLQCFVTWMYFLQKTLKHKISHMNFCDCNNNQKSKEKDKEIEEHLSSF